MLEERYGKFTILKFKLSRLSYIAVEYFPFSIVISIRQLGSAFRSLLQLELAGVYACYVLVRDS